MSDTPSPESPSSETMRAHMGTAFVYTIVSVIALGIVYPLILTGLAALAFPRQANGSLVRVDGVVVGSDLVGTAWHDPRYFSGRPSAAGKGYDPTSTGGTNLGPTSKKLIDATRAALKTLRAANPEATGPIPMDLVTSSASGIDPDISPEAAYYEAPRIAKARGIGVAAVNDVIARLVHGRTLGFLGEPHVNVLELNLALDGKLRSAGLR